MREQFKLAIRAWQILKPFHKWLYINILLAFILSGISVAITFSGSQVLSSITTGNIRVVVFGFVAMFVLEIIWNLVDYFKNDNERIHLDQDIAQYLQKISLEKILSLTPEQHIEDHSAIKQQIIARGESAIETIVKIFTYDFLPNVSYLIIAILTLTWHNPLLGGVSFLICAILAFWIYRFTNYYRPFVKKNRDNWTEQHKIRTEAFTHLSLIKILGRESYFVKKYLDNRKEYADFDTKISRISLKHRTLRTVFVTSSDNLIFFFAIILTLQGTIEVASVFLVWTLVGRVFWSITGLSNSLRDLPLRTFEAEKYFEAVDKIPSFEEKGLRNIDLRQHIHFRNVVFKYEKSKDGLFKSISFSIPQGKTTAFVGSSGSGKSTITKLLLRAYKYTSGSILIGDRELSEIDATYLREHIGYVEQHVDLLDDTIKENILLGVPSYQRKLAENNLERIASLARIDQFYHRLGEKKFETIVGERGIKLSGGERQRVGIARAIIKNPEILIFDEATSSLDSENEKYVMEAINDVSRGKTTIIIAHRLSTIKSADKIIVMNKGSVVGEGTHNELMNSNLTYQNLVNHQLSK